MVVTSTVMIYVSSIVRSLHTSFRRLTRSARNNAAFGPIKVIDVWNRTCVCHSHARAGWSSNYAKPSTRRPISYRGSDAWIFRANESVKIQGLDFSKPGKKDLVLCMQDAGRCILCHLWISWWSKDIVIVIIYQLVPIRPVSEAIAAGLKPLKSVPKDVTTSRGLSLHWWHLVEVAEHCLSWRSEFSCDF